MEKNNLTLTLGLCCNSLVFGLRHMGAPHWLCLLAAVAGIGLLFHSLGRRTPLKAKKLALLRTAFGKKRP